MRTKTCPKCRETLSDDKFKLKPDLKFPTYCIQCEKLYQQEYSKKHSAKKTQKAIEWNKAHPERRKEIARIWSKENYDLSKIDKVKALARYRKWRESNHEKARANEKRYREKNPEVIKYAQSLRRSNIRRPSWFGELDELVLKEAYALSRLRAKATGFQWHVDHIVPIKGLTVSGLHSWSNIAVITWKDNLAKSNKVWPDMP